MRNLVRDAYQARSKYAHGSDPADVDLPALRRVVRACVLAELVIDRSESLGNIADAALLHHACLAENVRTPMSDFWREVDANAGLQ